ncbi:GLEYA domain-containing protein [Microdochium nivale]|nr:GLEYA domain-containing protein [Microdochium nivale]
MRASTFIAAALPLGISALPAPAIVEDRGLIGSLICIPYQIVVNNILADTFGIQFCAQYTKIPTVTVTNIVTSAAQAVTITSPVTINGGGAITVTSMATTTLQPGVPGAVTSVVTVSVTVPTATTGATCLNSAYSAPTITSTVVSTSLIAAKTVTSAPTTTVNPGAKVTVVSTMTITPAAAAAGGKTVTSTVTSTVGSVATSIAANGLVYKKFDHKFDGYSQNSGFGADFFHGKTPEFTGVWNSLNFATPYWPSMEVDPTLQLDQANPFDTTQAALLFAGFFLAPQTGTYTFSVPADFNDNFAHLWTGSAAMNWADSATAFKAVRTSNTSKGGSTTVKLNAGDAMPFAYLWANGFGAARSALNIVFPDGSSPADSSQLFAQPCSDSVFAL